VSNTDSLTGNEGSAPSVKAETGPLGSRKSKGGGKKKKRRNQRVKAKGKKYRKKEGKKKERRWWEKEGVGGSRQDEPRGVKNAAAACQHGEKPGKAIILPGSTTCVPKEAHSSPGAGNHEKKRKPR